MKIGKFQPSVAYKSVAYKIKSVYAIRTKIISRNYTKKFVEIILEYPSLDPGRYLIDPGKMFWVFRMTEVGYVRIKTQILIVKAISVRSIPKYTAIQESRSIDEFILKDLNLFAKKGF